MRITTALLLAGLSVLGSHASSIEFTKNLKMGWSLGNTLDANCSDWLDYSEDQTASETCWGNVKTTEALFTSLMNEFQYLPYSNYLGWSLWCCSRLQN